MINILRIGEVTNNNEK